MIIFNKDLIIIYYSFIASKLVLLIHLIIFEDINLVLFNTLIVFCFIISFYLRKVNYAIINLLVFLIYYFTILYIKILSFFPLILNVMFFTTLLALIVKGFKVLDIDYIQIREFFSKMKKLLESKNETFEKGDLIVAKDKDKNKDIIVPFKDRFLHFLILGPTGSGKTSQTLIPFINRDMKNKDIGMTIIEPKGDLVKKVFLLGKVYNRKIKYFEPTRQDCPYFNPLYGKEDEVVENIITAFNIMGAEENTFFKNMNEQLLRNAVKLIKRLKKDNAKLLDLNDVVNNIGTRGMTYVNNLKVNNKNEKDEERKKENDEIIEYFLLDYYKKDSKTYEYTTDVRAKINKLISNKYLRKVLNPKSKTDIDFNNHLKNKDEEEIIVISTAQGSLGELGAFLGYFLILSYQMAVFKRKGDEETRKPHTLILDEAQKYLNKGITDILTQGRSYKVSVVLATQSLGLIEENAGMGMLETIKTNCRNNIIFGGISYKDAEHFSNEFGEIKKKKKTKGTTKPRFSIFESKKSVSITDNITETSEEEKRFKTEEIIYQDFSEVIVQYVKNNTLQTPIKGEVSFIDEKLNEKTKKIEERGRCK